MGHIVHVITLPDIRRRCATERFGPFEFQLGLDASALELPLVRATDAQHRFTSSPLAQVASTLEREVLVQSVYGTNTIEGAELTEEQTAQVLGLSPEQIQLEQQIRVRNIKAAYDVALGKAVTPGWTLNVDYLQAIHAEISRDLTHADNRPGRLRDNPKDRVTYVGDTAHGGQYKPPQNGRDIKTLLLAMIDWHDDLLAAGVPALIRAPLMHLYFERIHPFWDGNGRVGRVLEATLLRQAGFRYAPFALSRFYLDQIDRYFTLFNTCRKADENGRPFPNQDFVVMHLEGMLQVTDRLQKRVDGLVEQLLFEAQLSSMADKGEINVRQYAIVRLVMDRGRPITMDDLRREPGYTALYRRLTEKTRQRDMNQLRQLHLLHVNDTGELSPGVVVAGKKLPR